MQFRPSPDQPPGQSHTPTGCKRRGPARRAPASTRLLLEALEERTLLSFSPAVGYAAGAYPYALASAHFNNDAFEDLAVANYSGSSVSILLGNADGTFQPAQDFPTGPNPIAIAVGDFDDDGNMDVATANAGGFDASVLLGNGDGTLQAANSLSLGSSPTSVAVGDFDKDGNLDLGVTTNYYTYGGGYWYWYPGYYTSYANVLLGNGDGGFSGPNSSFAGYGYHLSAAVADFNGDDVDDFATVNYEYWTVSVLFGGDPSRYLQGPIDYSTGAYPVAVATADVDGDLDADLVTANSGGNDVSVLPGDGLGGFGGPQNYAAGSSPSALVLGDFTGDLKLDITTANGWNNTVSVLRGGGDGSFASPALTAIATPAWALAAADFNGDGWLDAVTANPDGNNVSVLLNTQDWRSLQVGGFPSPVEVGQTHTITVTALATDGSLLTGYTGTVHFSSSDPLAVLPDDYVFTSADNGAKTFSVTLGTAGTQSVMVNDATTPALAGQQTVFVNPPPPATFAVGDSVVTETDAGTVAATFTVTRGGNLDGTVTVNYSTVDGGALAGSDYVAQSESLTFGPDELSRTITVLVNGDVTDEHDQAFYVVLWNAVGADIVDDTGEGMILDNDAAPTITITAKVSLKEGKNRALTSFDFIVTLSAPSEKDIQVNFATANGTATTADNDYTPRSGTLFFAAGDTRETISVQVKGDKRKESNETFFVNLSGALNASILVAQGLGEILDDDAAPGKGPK